MGTTRDSGEWVAPGTEHPSQIETVLLDVGGTLWPDGPPIDRYISYASARLGKGLGLGHDDAVCLAGRLSHVPEPAVGHVQDTERFVTDVLEDLGWGDRQLDVARIFEEMCVPAREVLEPFAGADQLLANQQDLGRRVAIVSNTQWRDGDAYRQDFADFGLADYIDAYVTSLDVGYRKPHPAMFRAALAALDAAPATTIMIGNSLDNDIVPARHLGLRTLLVAIEAQPPDNWPPDQVCTSLIDLRRQLAMTDEP